MADVSRETLSQLHAFADDVITANVTQNLISKASEADIWSRHIGDSAQLLRFEHKPYGIWLDLGSGPGFPGIVIAMLRPQPIVLVESRTKRVDFLRAQIFKHALSNAQVIGQRLESVDRFAVSVISARAFAPLSRLLPLAIRFATPETLWILPKGRSAAEELASVRDAWHGDFRIEPSLVDPQSGIIVATDVRRKA